MKEKNIRRYKKRTKIGYFFFGLIAFFVGVAYGLYEDAKWYTSITEALDFFWNNFFIIGLGIGSSSFFYVEFFEIRQKIDDISAGHIENGVSRKLEEYELFELRNSYLKIWKDKQKKTNEPLKEDDILQSNEPEHMKQALKNWFGYRKEVVRIPKIFGVYILFVSAILFFTDKEVQLFSFFCPYIALVWLSLFFYCLLFYTLRIKSLVRLSYCVLYPTVLTIAVNIYFGLSIHELCSNKFPLSAHVPVAVFVFFFFVTAAIEFLSYKIDDDERSQRVSTYGFVGISLFALFAAIIVFFLSTNFVGWSSYKKPFSNLLFAIALALYLGIFEGWDSLRNINLEESSILFAKHYRWWNFLQICYPLAFFFLMGLVKSEIFTFGLMVTFTIMSVVSTIVWKRGGEKEEYCQTNWEVRKIIFGIITVVLVFANRLIAMNGMFAKTPPAGLDTKDINVELIVVLLGVVNGMFVFLGVKADEQKKFVLMALPLKEVENYKDFSDFCKYGYIYDFCNYIYLIYILVVHVLLFSTGFLDEGFKGFESAATILIIFMVIIYMFFSFKSKILNVDTEDLYVADPEKGKEEILDDEKEQKQVGPEDNCESL